MEGYLGMLFISHDNWRVAGWTIPFRLPQVMFFWNSSISLRGKWVLRLLSRGGEGYGTEEMGYPISGNNYC